MIPLKWFFKLHVSEKGREKVIELPLTKAKKLKPCILTTLHKSIYLFKIQEVRNIFGIPFT